LGGLTFLINWAILIYLNNQKLEKYFSGRFSLLKTLLTYLLLSSLGVLFMGVLFVSALMFSHG
tara:strand:- start:694 stop:882 length:189 start_codon:yes stop_codon:yes gene_type:complete